MNEAVSNTSLNVFSEYCLKITKTIRNVVPEAINLQLTAFAMLRNGFSLCFLSMCFFDDGAMENELELLTQ